MSVHSGFNPMTFQSVPIMPFEQLADDIPGFTSDEQKLADTLRTTIFVSGASAASEGRASYIIGNDGERQWLPNTLTCWINDLNIITQNYEQYDPVEKLLVEVTSINGSTWCYRMGLDSWASSSLLSSIRQMTRAQLVERIHISLSPKGRATFLSVACIESDLASYQRVEIPRTDLGRKLGYTEMLDVITYFHLAQSANQAEFNEQAQKSLAPTQAASKAVLGTRTLESDQKALEAPMKPRRTRSKSPVTTK